MPTIPDRGWSLLEETAVQFLVICWFAFLWLLRRKRVSTDTPGCLGFLMGLLRTSVFSVTSSSFWTGRTRIDPHLTGASGIAVKAGRPTSALWDIKMLWQLGGPCATAMLPDAIGALLKNRVTHGRACWQRQGSRWAPHFFEKLRNFLAFHTCIHISYMNIAFPTVFTTYAFLLLPLKSSHVPLSQICGLFLFIYCYTYTHLST